ncbi:MAG TPA: penicillin-binding transpeptidase domain-containing protein [Longimicrobiales bacterium]|nr:penicillin-binding transpeptidase domain-containing protein [Longimicrobiales bacterium]
MTRRAAGAGKRTGTGPAARRRLLLIGFLVVSGVLLGRAFHLAIVQGGIWRERAVAQHGDTLNVPAPRGSIYDRNGIPLAGTQEVFRIAIAPRELRDRDQLIEQLRRHSRLSGAQLRGVTEPSRRWVVLPGVYPASVREALDEVPGVYFEAVLQRFYPHGAVAMELLGMVGADGAAQGGLELELDTVLRGAPGRSMVRRDSRGRMLPGAMLRTREPVPGRDVHLTLDLALQEIAEGALAQAVVQMSAQGGELLLADPATGEILAAASRAADRRARSWRAVTEPYEPGSTLKPFIVAALLTLGRAQLEDSVFAENGRYRLPGRVLSDVHGYGMLSLADALRKSSNIAIAKLAMRLEPAEQYLALRDFGFGVPTGVSYPSESGGLLRRPARWSRMSQTSLAIGYELNVTPLQMAMAYGAIANGGLLLEPRLVREVRGRDGSVVAPFTPRAVRRALPARVAAQLREVLEGAVTDGTARAAALGPFSVAGKTGTTRIAATRGYRAGAYYASFAGFFPAEDPQLVFLVKLDEPRGEYYGGLAAAPVIRVALEAALAAHRTPLDRRAVATPAPILPEGGELRPAALLPRPEAGGATRAAPHRVALRRPGSRRAPAAARARVQVPDTEGLAVRDAVRLLHGAGFHVQVHGRGRVRITWPLAGAEARAGSLVEITAGGA